MTFGSFRQRIMCPLRARQQVARIRQRCEIEAGSQNRLAALANHGLVLSIFALAELLLPWDRQEVLLVALSVLWHEFGHAAAVRMAGISRGHLLIPLFGAAAVPKTAYRSEASPASSS